MLKNILFFLFFVFFLCRFVMNLNNTNMFWKKKFEKVDSDINAIIKELESVKSLFDVRDTYNGRVKSISSIVLELRKETSGHIDILNNNISTSFHDAVKVIDKREKSFGNKLNKRITLLDKQKDDSIEELYEFVSKLKKENEELRKFVNILVNTSPNKNMVLQIMTLEDLA